MGELQIIERKLGREKALGLCYQGEDLIEIDPRQSPKEYLDTCIHELLHVALPDLKEAEVEKTANFIAKYLWKKKYRMIRE